MSDGSCAFHFNYSNPHEDHYSGCQFGADEELFPCGGRLYCRFHLPLADDDEQPTAKTANSGFDTGNFNRAIYKWINDARREKRSVNLTGVVFHNDFEFVNKEFPEILLYRAVFRRQVHFKGTRFTGDAFFENAQFMSTAWFSGAKFIGDAKFSNVQFKEPAFFENAQFNRGANFYNALFTEFTWFNDAQFVKDTSFSRAHLEGARFENAKFMGDAPVFSDTVFVGHASFKDAQFKGNAFFEKVQFTDSVWFDRAQFTGDAWFKNAVFKGHALFDGAQFTGGAWFVDAVFKGGARYSDAHFMSGASFVNAVFEGDANFSWSPPNPSKLDSSFRDLDFSGGRVDGVADFGNRIFTKAADFSKRIFAKAPVFHGSEIHQGTDWHGTRFRENRGHKAEKAYRTLRLAMEKIRDRPQEAIFFSLEQCTMRNNLPLYSPTRLLSCGYHWTSNYGSNVGLPLLWLVITTILFFPLYWAIDGRAFPDCDVAKDIFTFYVQQIVRPFWIWSGTYLAPTGLFGGIPSLCVKIVASLQSVVCLTLIALFVLALRWRFRRA